MKLMRIKLCLGVLVFLFSCQNKHGRYIYEEKNSHFLIKDYYIGTLLREKTVKIPGKDTILDGEASTYDSSGTILEKGFWKDNIKNGYYEYYMLGELYEKGYYKNGLRDSTWSKYNIMSVHGKEGLASVIIIKMILCLEKPCFIMKMVP